MPITRKHVSKAQRTSMVFSAVFFDKSAAGSSQYLFTTGSMACKITKLLLMCVAADFATDDCAVSLGAVARRGAAGSNTLYATAKGFLNATRGVDGSTQTPIIGGFPNVGAVDVGDQCEHDLDVIVPPGTIVNCTSAGGGGAGGFFVAVEFEMMEPTPTMPGSGAY